MKKILITFLFLAMFLFTTACGTSLGNGTPSTDESNWQLGQGELPSQIGDLTEPIIEIPKQFFDYHEVWQKTEYDKPTGKWFLENGTGVFGYGLTSGTQKPSSQIDITLFGHNPDGDQLNRDIRIQLSTRDANLTKKELLIEEVVHVDQVKGEEIIYTGILPNEENVFYILSAEILSEDGSVEDTRITSIYVPAREINAAMNIDEDLQQEATLILENYGPTILFLGKAYTLEKKVEEQWRIVPLDIAFEDIGIILSLGDTFEQKVNIQELSPGTYRLIKDVYAEGFDDLKATLATEFSIK